jgi:hypothetical protein
MNGAYFKFETLKHLKVQEYISTSICSAQRKNKVKSSAITEIPSYFRPIGWYSSSAELVR